MGAEQTESATKAPRLKRGARHRSLHWVVLVFNVVVALACFVGAGVLVIGQRLLTDTKKSAAIETPTSPAATPSTPGLTTSPESSAVADSVITSTGETTTTSPAADIPTTTEPFPLADPQAQNFLI